ncbi:MAG: histone deacetylase [Dehalococcoidales bacterium]|nr:histone deacetylase [Dehalococcoidales bacterium]
MPVGILYREELKEYDFGPGHPFRGDRYQLFPEFLKNSLTADDNYRILKARAATEKDLLLICQKDYIDFTKEYFRAAHLGLPRPFGFPKFHSGDNLPVSKPGKLEETARLIIGQAKMACDLVQKGEYQKIISLGGGMHHAKIDYGEGFCIYNDVAFCGRYLMDKYGLERILILDTDAHAGNGTSDYFYDEPRVLFIDLHQDPWTLYPGTGLARQIGRDRGTGFTVNVPLPVEAGYDSYQLVFESLVEPLVKEFKPQIIIRNGGSDPYFNDKLTSLGLPVKGFRMIGDKVREMARICDGKVIDLIASGYDQKALPYVWLALISGLAGMKLDVEEPRPIPSRLKTDRVLIDTKKVVREVKNYLKDYWSCFR